MADGVDAPGHVVEDEHPHQPGPDQCLDILDPRSPVMPKPTANGMQQAEREPDQIQPIDRADDAVTVKIPAPGGPALHALGIEQPSHVGVVQALDRPDPAVSIPVRRMRVAVAVRVGMVSPVVGDPLGDGPLGRHRPRDRQRAAQPSRRLEAAVRKQAVVADRDPEPAKDVEDREQHQIQRVQGDTPQHALRPRGPRQTGSRPRRG